MFPEKQTKITHLTSAHPRYDTRIFIKMCISLAKNENYQVNLVVADGKGDETKNGVDIVDIGAKTGGRISRMTKTVKRVFKKAVELDSDIYHLHDPELIPIGLKLKKLGKKVIFDAHEDLPKQVMAKHYLGNSTKKILSFLIAKFEVFALKRLDYVITATPIIRDKFSKHNIFSQDINNFPKLDELIDLKPSFTENTICYIGLLYETRGIKEIVQAIEKLDIKLIVAGKFHDKLFEDEITALKGWQKVDFRGFVNRDEVKEILSESIAGLVTLHPTPSYVEAYPVKMFEYMSAGLATIASKFPIYKDFIDGNNCGICVNPLNPKEIAEAIEYITTHPKEAEKMGINGKKAVIEKYNWDMEEKKLFQVYKELMSYE